MHFKPRLAIILLAISLGTASHAVADTELLYDVDFSTPPHMVGSVPTTGAGQTPRDVPTEVVFGDPTVVAQLGALTDQPCSFGNGTTGYDQLEFAVDPSHPDGFSRVFDEYHLQMTLLIEQYGSGELFRIFFDCPTVNSIGFYGDGTIRLYPAGVTVGTFVFGTPLQLEVDLDVLAEDWAVYLDGSLAYSGPLTGDLLYQFRMNLSGTHEDSRVAIDDLLLYGGPITGIAFLYHTDFGNPPHSIGSAPVVGSDAPPRKTPTEIRFGDPTVVVALGSLTEQPCAFGNGTTGYDQLQFDVDPVAEHGFAEAYGFYMLSMDLLVDAFLTGESFEIVLDCPSVHKIMFLADETVQIYPGNETIGQYSSGSPMDFRVGLDVLADEWTIWLNGDFAYTGPASAEMLRSLRIHLSGTNAAHQAAVDNVYMWGWGSPVSEVHDPRSAAAWGSVTTYPNPTQSGSWIQWAASPDSPVRIEVFDATGRRIWAHSGAGSAEGTGVVWWNGHSTGDRAMPSGVYFARVLSEGRFLGGQTIVLRR